MNKKKLNLRTVYCIMTVVLALGFFVVNTRTACAADLTEVSYENGGVILTGTTDGETVTITGSNSETQYYDVVIPDEIDGKPVCDISANAFQNNAYITSVSLPDGVSALPERAFYGCSAIKTLNLNMVSDLGSDSTGYTTLEGTWSLETITVSEDNPGLTVCDGVLFNKDMTKLLLYPTLRPGTKYEIPDGVSQIWQRAFYMTQEIEEVTLSDDISSYSYSFFKCPSLKILNLNMLADINGTNFSRCYAITTVTVSENNPNLAVRRGVLFSKDAETNAMKDLLFYPPGRDEETYTVPEGVEQIGSNAFRGSSLRQISLPDSLKVAGAYCFAYCSALEELVFPEGLQSIMSNATTGCDSLAAVYVPDSVTEILPGSLDGPMNPPYAVMYGHTCDSVGNYTAVYQYVEDHSGEYVFKDIDTEKMPRRFDLNCATELDMDEDFSEFTIEADCLAKAVFESNEPDIVSVDENGKMTAHYDGTAVITVRAPADAYHDEQSRIVTVKVTGLGTKPQPVDPVKPDPQPDKTKPVSQMIKGKTDFNAVYGSKAFSLKQSAKTTLTYRSSNSKIATVSKAGKVRILRPGKVKIYVTAAASDKYLKAKKTITVKASLKKPSLRIRTKGTKTKLTWSKVLKSKGYEVYVRFPGKRKYEKVLTEAADVKSVTHRGLTKGKTYRYKVRAYTKIGGKKYCSAFSKVGTARIR